MPITYTIETNDEFIDRHGRDGIEVNNGSTLLFSDGASMDIFTGKLRKEPPEDPKERLRLQQYYRKKRLERSEKEYENIKINLNTQLKHSVQSPLNCPPPSARDLETLKRLRDRVKRDREALENINAEVIASEPDRQISHFDQVRADAEREAQRIADEIADIIRE